MNKVKTVPVVLTVDNPIVNGVQLDKVKGDVVNVSEQDAARMVKHKFAKEGNTQ